MSQRRPEENLTETTVPPPLVDGRERQQQQRQLAEEEEEEEGYDGGRNELVQAPTAQEDDYIRQQQQGDDDDDDDAYENDRELSLSESTVIPPVTHDREEWTEGVPRRQQEEGGKRRRDNGDGELALTESTVIPPVTRDREGWTEGRDFAREEEGMRTRPYTKRREEEEEQEEEEEEEEEEEGKEIPEALRTRRARKLSGKATHLYSVSFLVFFSIWGTLARLGLQSLTMYTGAPVVTSVLWANVAGCIVMGFFLEDRNTFKDEWGDGLLRLLPTTSDKNEKHERIKKHKAVKKGLPLYIGLTTGFCGCLTSFSAFLRDVFLALSDDMHLIYHYQGSLRHRNGGYSFMALVGVMAIEVGLSLSALVFGAHLALGLTDLTPTIPFRVTRKFVEPVCVFLGWGCWLGSIFLAIWPPDRHNNGSETWRGRAIFSVVFAPLGCLFRYYVSMFLNARIPTFPLGTFTANVVGTCITGMCFDLQHVGFTGGGVLTSCQVLEGVMDGFCGSATTVSTWAAELNGLGRRRWAYFYGLMSVGVSLAFLVVIMGSLRWTKGFAVPVCG